MCEEITYLFPNLNCATVEVWEWISNFISHFTEHVKSMQGVKLNQNSKKVPW